MQDGPRQGSSDGGVLALMDGRGLALMQEASCAGQSWGSGTFSWPGSVSMPTLATPVHIGSERLKNMSEDSARINCAVHRVRRALVCSPDSGLFESPDRTDSTASHPATWAQMYAT